MKKQLFYNLIFLGFIASVASAQVPEVPSVINFADMTLRLNEQARREIQADVNALYRSPNYFQIKLDRVNLYMPVVERVLVEYGVPADMKYLVIQESSLISDAVSTSNAVGFWQFKKGTAEEVFMRVDNEVDERKNIVSSTRGAAEYLKKHQRYLDNWAIALISYQMGLGGARGHFGDQYKGKRTMDIDRNSHWYLKKFLAHKVAFEGKLGQLVSNGDYLHEYAVKGPTTLAAVAKTLGVSENHLREQNKWATTGQIPADKVYTVCYIQKGAAPARPAIAAYEPKVESAYKPAAGASGQNTNAFPKVTGNTSKATQPGHVQVNGIQAVMASRSGDVELLSDQTDIKSRKLRRVNDLKRNEPIVGGTYYYTKRKKAKAAVAEHIVQQGESLWKIAQLYGIRLHSLKAKNRIYKDEDLRPGMVIKLQDYRSRNEAVKVVSPPSQQAPETSKPVQVAEVRSGTQRTNAESPAPVASVQNIEHVVQPGDTLYAISRKHGVSVDQLRVWNNIDANNLLKVGQKLIIKK
nr:LysM peptidoglycan-binding domain-containing protein [Cytophagales bacterium]